MRERRARELNARRTNDVDPVGGPVGGGGHTQVVSIDVTFNGQDYVRSRHLFFYEPRDRFQVDEGCRVMHDMRHLRRDDSEDPITS